MPNPGDVLRYVKLPDELKNGTYDQYGHPVGAGEPASLVLNALPLGPWQVWGVFPEDLEPGQFGFLIFTNVAGHAVPAGAFTQWDRTKSVPYFTEDRLMVLYGVERARGRARISGRNDSSQPVAAAAGLLIIVPPPPAAPAAGKSSKQRGGRSK